MARLSPILKQATPVLVSRGAGVYLYDKAERRYLDFTSGIGVTSTGHCHPRVVEAARAQVGNLIHGQYTTVMHEPLLALTERLGEVLPEGIDSVSYTNSGSEAVESSIRLARHATGRPTIIAFTGGFHGRTMGASALTSSATKFRAGAGPVMPNVAFAPFPYAFRYGWSVPDAVQFALRELDYLLVTAAPAVDVAAIIVEPVLGEGGYVPTPPEFLVGLRERCDRHGILLIMDEVQTGVGRTGRFWGFQHTEDLLAGSSSGTEDLLAGSSSGTEDLLAGSSSGTEDLLAGSSSGTEDLLAGSSSGGFRARPDILITAKGLASGFPLSAIAAPEALMAKAWPGSQGGTYGGNAVACAAALATLDVIRDERLVENSAEQGGRLLEGLRKIAADHPVIADVRGLGLMIGNEFCTPHGAPDPATAIRAHAAAAERGLLLLTCGPYGNVVRMIPPLVVDADQIDEGLAMWADAVSIATERPVEPVAGPPGGSG